MASRKRNMEIRGVPKMSAFIGTINGLSGVWWKDHAHVYALDVKDRNGTKVGFTATTRNQYYYHSNRDTDEVVDYQGPIDLQIKVKCFSPWRGKHSIDVGPSHVEIQYDRQKDYRKGPRAVRLRDHLHSDTEVS